MAPSLHVVLESLCEKRGEKSTAKATTASATKRKRGPFKDSVLAAGRGGAGEPPVSSHLISSAVRRGWVMTAALSTKCEMLVVPTMVKALYLEGKKRKVQRNERPNR